MTDVWIRLYEEPGAQVTDLTAGWAMWLRREQQPWPHGEMRDGFTYYICRKRGARFRKITAQATVTRFHDFIEISSLDDAYTRLQPFLQSANYTMSRREWLEDDHNVEKDAEGRWPRFLAFWTTDVKRVPTVDLTGVKFGQTGWVKTPRSAIEPWGR